MLNLFRLYCALSFIAYAGSAYAQPPAPPPAPAPATSPDAPPATPAPPAAAPAAAPSVTETTLSTSREASNNQKDWHFIGNVEMERGADTKIYADDVWAYTGENRAVATGNVLFTQGANRISAEHAEFDTETRLGTFYNAWGLSTIKPQEQFSRPGAISAPQRTGEETVVYFFGEKIEKIGPKKYRITNGGFSTCVQPTPRWDLNAGTVILNIDHYTVLKQAILRVKGVPLFYLPIMYYPTKKEDRATGFLLPTYGSSTYKGQSLHNAFFWAINRSQDATVEHAWYSKTGQSVGTEYRYSLGGGDGNVTATYENQKATTFETGGSIPDLRSYSVRGGASQILPFKMRARANVDYFSSLQSSQLNNNNIADLSRNSRVFGGNLVGAWGKYSMNATLNRSESFYNFTSSTVSGTWPRVALTRNERPLGNSPVYFSISSEYAQILSERKTPTDDTDLGRGRFDVSPQIRYPFKRWQWFTVNSTVNWRDTYYTRTYEPTGDPNVRPSQIVDVPLNRPVLNVQSQIVGPVFNRIWDTPGNGYAEKFKHTVEPFLTVDRTSSVEEFALIVPYDGIDSYVGGTRLSYGVNNRFYAKRAAAPGQPAQAREIVDVEISQRYYTNQEAALYDRQSQITPTVPSKFSAIGLNIRVMPTNELSGTIRADFDSRYHELQYINAQTTYSWTSRVQASVGWSKRAFIAENPAFNNPAFLDHSLNASGTAHTIDNRFGGIYSFSYDVLRKNLVQQRMSAFYNAQCCGLAFEYQTFSRGAGSSLPEDHRFFLSFTLAGLGNFSPFNGALSGVPR
jgi:LPS-assembly protein